MRQRTRAAAVFVCFTAILNLAALAADAAVIEDAITVSPGHSLVLDVPGATAAYALDTNVVEARLSAGKLMVYGYGPGRTMVVIVSGSNTRNIDVKVEPSAKERKKSRPAAGKTTVDVRYSSAGKTAESVIDSASGTPASRRELHLETVNNLGSASGTEPRIYVRSGSYTISSAKRSLAFFDSYLEISPLTVDRTIVRGIHYIDERWNLHAGVTVGAPFASTILPFEPDVVIGARYTHPLTTRSSLAPTIFLYPSRKRDAGSGSVLSLAYAYDDHKTMKGFAEIALSHSLGAAGEWSYDGDRNRVHLKSRYVPRDFSLVGSSALTGFYSDGFWNGHAGRVSAEAAVSINDYVAGPIQQRSMSGGANVRYQLHRNLAVLTGADVARYVSPAGPAVQSVSVPAGIQLSVGRFGADVTLRYGRNSATDRGGFGQRLALRATGSRFFASAYYDRLTESPTVDVIFRDQPGLESALQDLGLTIDSYEDLVRALRNNPALAQLGFIEGVTIDLAPLRVQAGLEFSLLGAQAGSRQQLRFRYAMQRIERVSSVSEMHVGSLSYRRHVAAGTELYGTVHSRRSRRDAEVWQFDTVWEIGIRQQLDGDAMRSIFRRTGSISGIAFSDEELSGKWSASAKGVAGVVVELNGTRRTTTDGNGRFVFEGVARGEQELTAQVIPGAHFTTASRFDVVAGSSVSFGIALTPARMNGQVVDDVGRGVRASMTLRRTGAEPTLVTTEGDGTFNVILQEGDYEATIVPASLPSGYSIADRVRQITVSRDKTAQLAFKATIARTISGSIHAPSGETVTVSIQSLGRTATADRDGNFAIRSLPAGRYTITAHAGTRTIASQEVVVPENPGVLKIEMGSTGNGRTVATINRPSRSTLRASSGTASTAIASTPSQ